MEKLASDFVPGALDVICSRGKAAYQHQGNRSFRATLEHHLASYAKARSKQEKTEIVSLIYHGIQEATPEGGFIRKNDKGEWCRVPSHVAREKVGQGFRDLLHTEYRSSTKAKIKRRRERLYPPIKTPEGDEEKGQSGQTTTGTTARGQASCNTNNNPPAVGNGKVTKSFSYDSEPLPIDQGQQQQMSTILSQCSFSFVESSSSSEEKPQDTKAHAAATSRSRQDEPPQGAGINSSQGHNRISPYRFGQETGSPPSAPSVASLPQRSPASFLPLSQVENHVATWPREEIPPPYPYYHVARPAPHYPPPRGGRGPRDGYHDRYGGVQARNWGESPPQPSEDGNQRRKGYYHRWY